MEWMFHKNSNLIIIKESCLPFTFCSHAAPVESGIIICCEVGNLGVWTQLEGQGYRRKTRLALKYSVFLALQLHIIAGVAASTFIFQGHQQCDLSCKDLKVPRCFPWDWELFLMSWEIFGMFLFIPMKEAVPWSRLVLFNPLLSATQRKPPGSFWDLHEPRG